MYLPSEHHKIPPPSPFKIAAIISIASIKGIPIRILWLSGYAPWRAGSMFTAVNTNVNKLPHTRHLYMPNLCTMAADRNALIVRKK